MTDQQKFERIAETVLVQHKDHPIKALSDFAAQSVREDREQFKKDLALKVYEAMHDGVLKYGVRVKPSAKDLKKLIESTH